MRLHLSSYYKWLLLCSGVFVALVMSLALVNHTLAQTEEHVANAGEHIVSIYDRGEERVIVTKARNIRGALKAANIEIQEKQDVIEPSLDTELIASRYNVNIFRARPVTIVDGTVRQRITTAHQTPEQIAKTAGITLYKEDNVALSGADDLLVDGADTVMEIDRATPIQLTLYGKRAEVRTHVSTVAELLKEKGITVGEEDTLSVAPSAKLTAHMAVELWRNGVQTVTQEEDIVFPVEKIQDANREIGYREVKDAGEVGKKNVTYEIEMRNGQEVGRKEIASVTTKEPKKQVEVVGAKNNYSSSLNEWLLALRTCETRGNYQANTGNGFYGAYQFMPSTWNAIARRMGRADLVGVLPSQASPADQDAMVIANANATSGLSTQHPGCYKKLGLSNKPPAQ